MHDADVGADAADDYLVEIQGGQALLQVGVEKAAVAVLGHDVGVGDPLGQFGYDLRFLAADDAMHREHPELQVIRQVVVGDEQDC